MASSAEAPAATLRADQIQRRVFRAHELPLEWSKQDLQEKFQQAFPGHVFRVDSLYRNPIVAVNSALVAFNCPVPTDLLSLEAESVREVELEISDNEIIFDHCRGLTTLFEPSSRGSTQADIIFIHGLGGHAVGSWTAPNGKCWPRDFLGNSLESARIMTFGYEAKLNKDTSTSKLSDFGRQFLNDLSLLRNTSEAQRRPLFLVGHSFGGTIINWVLHELDYTSSHNEENRDNLKAIRCATFFGVPHQGMSVEFATALEHITQKRTDQSMTKTLRDLQPNSEMLTMLRATLTKLGASMRLITCVEQKLTHVPSMDGQKRPGNHAVDATGGRVFSQTEELIPIDADHKGMVKFGRKTDNSYQQIVLRLKRALAECGPITEEKRHELLGSLRFPEIKERQMAIGDACESTCEWLLQSPEYVSWFSSSKSLEEADPFLWIIGKPGSGKSTIMKFAQSRLKEKNDHTIAYFFDSKGTKFQKRAQGMLRSLLLQVLEQFREIPVEAEILERWRQGKIEHWRKSHLRDLLEYFVPRLRHPLHCYIDALDECDGDDGQDLVAFFKKLAHLSAKRNNKFRVCVSSTDEPNISRERRRTIRLEKQDGQKQDMIRYVEKTLHIKDGEITPDVQQALLKKASGAFMWVVLFMDTIGSVGLDQDHMCSLREKLDMVPADPSKLYAQRLDRELESDHQGLLRLCLQWVAFAKRPLTPTELYFIILSETDIDTLKSIVTPGGDQGLENAARSFVLELSHGFLEVVHVDQQNIVRLSHGYVPDFLQNDEGFRGKGHDLLKHGCLRFLENFVFPLSGDIKTAKNPSESERKKEEGWEATETASYPPEKLTSRDLAITDGQQWTQSIGTSGCDDSQSRIWTRPFSRYAMENVLYHADEAQSDGVTQVEFLQHFESKLSVWIQLLEGLPDSPSYHTDTTFLYLLCDQNFSELVSVHPQCYSYLDPEAAHIPMLEQELYTTPFFAALVKENFETISVFFQYESTTESHSTHFFDQRSEPRRYNELCESYLNSVYDLREELIALILTAKRRALPDYNAVNAFIMEPGNELLQLYLLLTGIVDSITQETLESLIEWIIKKGRLDFLQLCLDQGTIGLHNSDGTKALNTAIEEGQLSVVDMLLKLGVKPVEAKNAHGQSPLSVAVSRGHTEVARTLIECADTRMDPESRCHKGRTPLSWAAENGALAISKYLIEVCKVDKTSRDVYGMTPLNYATEGERRSLEAGDRQKAADFTALVNLLRDGRTNVERSPKDVIEQREQSSIGARSLQAPESQMKKHAARTVKQRRAVKPPRAQRRRSRLSPRNSNSTKAVAENQQPLLNKISSYNRGFMHSRAEQPKSGAPSQGKQTFSNIEHQNPGVVSHMDKPSNPGGPRAFTGMPIYHETRTFDPPPPYSQTPPHYEMPLRQNVPRYGGNYSQHETQADYPDPFDHEDTQLNWQADNNLHYGEPRVMYGESEYQTKGLDEHSQTQNRYNDAFYVYNAGHPNGSHRSSSESDSNNFQTEYMQGMTTYRGTSPDSQSSSSNDTDKNSDNDKEDTSGEAAYGTRTLDWQSGELIDDSPIYQGRSLNEANYGNYGSDFEGPDVSTQYGEAPWSEQDDGSYNSQIWDNHQPTTYEGDSPDEQHHWARDIQDMDAAGDAFENQQSFNKGDQPQQMGIGFYEDEGEYQANGGEQAYFEGDGSDGDSNDSSRAQEFHGDGNASEDGEFVDNSEYPYSHEAPQWEEGPGDATQFNDEGNFGTDQGVQSYVPGDDVETEYADGLVYGQAFDSDGNGDDDGLAYDQASNGEGNYSHQNTVGEEFYYEQEDDDDEGSDFRPENDDDGDVYTDSDGDEG